MRNLKRALSLALASVMVIGMMVVGTGASYEDVKATDNVEAIEVLQAVGIMTGDENGDFNPDANVTRNEIAVIMSNLLNLDYDYYRGVNPFTDVPDWAAPYVAACAAEGVVAGIGNNLYGGSNNVTAAEAALMIMKALGYFQYQADFDNDWQIATIRQASYINLFDNINANAETALTRNQIAQLVLNGLKANMVTFTGTVGTEIKLPDGTTWNSGYVAEYTSLTNANKKYDSIDTGTSNIGRDDQYYVQLGEELYNGDLKLSDDTDVFGRPARYWEYDGKEIGTYVNTDLLVQEYTAKVTGDTLYNLLSRNTVEDYTFDIVIDGEYESPANAVDPVWFTKNAINRNNDAAVGGTGNGVLTQVFVDNEEDIVTIAIINTFLAIASDDYNEKKDTAPFDVYGAAKTAGNVYYKLLTVGDDHVNMTASAEDFDVEDVVKGDAFLVTVADGEIQTMAAPEMISGTEIDSFETGSNKGDNVAYSKSAPSTVEVDGTEYKFAHAAEYDYEVFDYYTSSTPSNTTVNLKDKTYNLFLDAYGYVIGVEEVEKTNNYVFITGIDLNSSNLKNQTADASAIFMDGTMKVIKVNMEKSVIALNNADARNAVLNKWFTYTVNNSEVYTVNQVIDGDNDAAANANATIFQFNDTTFGVDGNGEPNVIKIDDRNITVDGGKADAADHGLYKAYGTDETVYITVSLGELNNDYATGSFGIIDGVDSVATGIGNVSLTAWSRETARDEADDTKNGTVVGGAAPDYTMVSNGVYSLYNDDGDVIAAIVVGEDAGSAKNLVYVHTSSTFKETYDKTADQWTWSRKVVLNGEEVVLTEVGDGLSDLGSMVQHTWYQVKFNADGNVISVEKASTALKGHEIVDTYYGNAIETAVNDKDTVLYYSTNPQIIAKNLSLTGRTLWLDTNTNKGFRVAEDVKVVLIQTNNRTEKTYFETGVNSLKTIVNDLNDRHASLPLEDYVISAILEKGVATSVVIYDDCGRTCDPYQDPDWGTVVGDIKSIDFVKEGAFNLRDSRNNVIITGTYKYELQRAGVNGYTVVTTGTLNAASATQAAGGGNFFAGYMTGGNSYRLIVDGVVSDVVYVPAP